jgi:tetratricopeptide (TPR) repeat protein
MVARGTMQTMRLPSLTLWVLSSLSFLGCAHLGDVRKPAQSKGDVDVQIVLAPELMKKESQRGAAWMAYGVAKASTVTSPKRIHPYAGVDDFDTEYDARLMLVQTWKLLTAEKPERDPFLDLLVRIHEANFLAEYVITQFAQPGWTIPADALGKMNLQGFFTWGKTELSRHVVETMVRVRSKEMPDSPPVPFESLSDPSASSPKRMPCSRSLPSLRKEAQALREEAKRLRAAPLAAEDRGQFIAFVSYAVEHAKDYPQGVVWVSPKALSLNYYAGFCSVDVGDNTGAVPFLEAAIRLNPLFLSPRNEFVQTLVNTKQFDKALAEIDTMESLARGKCDRALALRKRGFVLFEQGKLKESYDVYQKSLAFDPTSKVAYDEMISLSLALTKSGTLAPSEKQRYAPPATRQVTTQCTEAQ